MGCLEVAGNLGLAVYVRVYKVIITEQCLVATCWLGGLFGQRGGKKSLSGRAQLNTLEKIVVISGVQFPSRK